MFNQLFRILRLPANRIDWLNSSFLIGTALVTVTAVPWYIIKFGLDWFQVALFLAFFVATGLSITLGYHRLFSHISFRAAWPVRLATLVFGAAAFENSALNWSSDHRRHHKHTDHDDDPYDITKGFWHAHIGWILFKLSPQKPLDNVADLRRDPLVRLQDRFYVPLAISVSFLLPALLGWLHSGWVGALGGFLIAGVARVVFVQQMTFCINSLCHTIGRQPYSTSCSARDSGVMALFTFGEGYHNYHHRFQHDYRNGVKWYHFDPTKWTILALAKLGLVRDLRRVPEEQVVLAQITEARLKLEARLSCEEQPLTDWWRHVLESSDQKLCQLGERWQAFKDSCNHSQAMEQARQLFAEMRREVEQTARLLRDSRNCQPLPTA